MRPRVLERVGRALRFSPEGRAVRVWVQGMPGADETEVVAGTLSEVAESEAVLTLEAAPDAASRRLRVVPHEPGWGFHALWFSFIAVDVFEPSGEPVGRWFIRLGTP